MSFDRKRGRPEPIRLLNRVLEEENGDPLVAMETVAPSLRFPRPQTIRYCRRTVAEMAERAARKLPEGVFLAVTDAWRPLERQRRIYEWMTQCVHEAFPKVSYAAARRRVNRWVAPYDQKAPPGHCTGAALDVMLVDSNDESLDVISPFPRFRANPTFVNGLSEAAHRNRMILVETMLGEGFSNCRDEWWHYSYGDAGWAVRMGLDRCFYGIVTIEQSIYAEQEQLWADALGQRPNPFL